MGKTNSYDQYVDQIKKAVELMFHYSGKNITKVEIKNMLKNNRNELVMIIYEKPSDVEAGIVPIIYLNNFVNKVKSNEWTPVIAAKEIIKIYNKHKQMMNFDIESFLTKEYIESHTCLEPTAYTDETFFEDKVFLKNENLAFIYLIEINVDELGNGAFLLLKPLANYLEVDTDKCIENYLRKHTFEIESLDKLYFEMLYKNHIIDKKTMDFMISKQHNSKDYIPMYMVYLEGHKDYGASILAFPDEFAKLLKENDFEEVYVLPVSKHEIIVVPTFSDLSVQELIYVVKTSNANVLSSDDVLSNSIYVFNVNEKKLHIK